MIKSIGHLAVRVKDMEESLKFYTVALGFKKVFEIPNPADGSPWIVYLNVCPGQFVELFYGGEKDNPWNPSLIGFDHICLEVDDIHKSAQQVKDAGYALTAEPKEGVDFNWQAWTMDPNGIRVELMQMDPRSPHAKYL